MNPVAFNFFGIPIMWYGIILSTGILVGIFLAYSQAKRKGHNPEYILDLALWCVPMAVVGARLYYVAFEWQVYKHNPIEVFNIRGGGLAIHGAIIAAVLTGYIITRIKDIPFRETIDIVAPSLILGQAIGRWGNYANGEAHGGPTNLPWAINVNGEMVHPTFLYESIWNLLVFVFLVWYSKRKKVEGELFLLYGILYSVGRFFIEGLRTDSLMFLGMRTAQLISVLICIVFGTLIFYLRKKEENIIRI